MPPNVGRWQRRVRNPHRITNGNGRSWWRELIRRGNGLHLDGLGLGVERAYDGDFLSRKLLRRLLVAQRVDVFAVIEHVRAAMVADAGPDALGVGRSHSHSRMIGPGALVVRNGSGEGRLALP